MEIYHYDHYSTIWIQEDTEDNLGIIADSSNLANTYRLLFEPQQPLQEIKASVTIQPLSERNACIRIGGNGDG